MILKMLRTTFVLILTTCNLAFSQELDSLGTINRNKAESILQRFLPRQLKGNRKIVFSVGEEYYLILIKSNGKYFEHYYQIDDKGRILKSKVTGLRSSKELLKIFDEKNYEKNYVTFSSFFFKSGYKLAEGNMTYFVLKDERDIRYGEAVLSFHILPNPIKAEIYFYLTDRILELARQ
jgi:hypothetical protein